MKKTLVALAALAATGAFAQANITGAVGFGYQNTTAGAKGLVNTDANLTIAASEDLGGGMKAAAKYALDSDGARGAGASRADASLALTTSVGQFVLANTRSGGNQAAALVAPVNVADGFFGGQNADVISRQAIDVLAYAVPVGSVTLAVKYVESSNDGSTTPNTTTTVLAGTYASGPLTATLAYNQSAFVVAPVADPRTTSYDLSVVYDAGIAKVGLGYDSARRGKANGTDTGAVLAGVSIPMGQLSIGFNYGKRDVANFSQIGINYDLSKRTALNASAGYYTTNASVKTDEMKISLVHSF